MPWCQAGQRTAGVGSLLFCPSHCVLLVYPGAPWIEFKSPSYSPPSLALSLSPLGRNNVGQLGNNNANGGASVYQAGIAVAMSFSFIASGQLSSCGLVGGTAYCWGACPTGMLMCGPDVECVVFLCRQ